MAARQQFGEHGYRATTTRKVAAQAGVSEPTIFRQFGSKAGLFEDAVVAPFTGFIEQQLTGWELREAGTVPIVDETRHFYGDLFDLFSEERSVIPALLAAYHDDVTPAVSRRLQDCMRQVVAMLEVRTLEESRIRGNVNFDVPCMARIMIAMTFALGTLPHLFNTQRLSRDRVIEEMAQLTAYGAEFRGQPIRDDPSECAHSVQPIGRQHASASDNAVEQLVDDRLWHRIEPILTVRANQRRRGRHPVADRTVLEGILHVLTTGMPWSALPCQRFSVSGTTCWRRYREWQNLAVWSDVLPLLQSGGIDLSYRP
jgi:AcrR family transcriptional regulator